MRLILINNYEKLAIMKKFLLTLKLCALFSFMLFTLPTIYAQDTDGDGVVDTIDIDDDNDGILDTVEGTGSESQSIGSPSVFTYTSSSSGNLSMGAFTVNINSQRSLGSNGRQLYGGGDATVVLTFSAPITDLVLTFADWGGQERLKNLSPVPTSLSSDLTFFNGNEVQTVGAAGGSLNSASSSTMFYTNMAPTTVVSFRLKIINCCSTDFEFINIAASFLQDSDNDGILNSEDLDSDNDGIPDNVEAQLTNAYITYSGPGNSPSFIDVNNDGLDDNFDAGVIAGGAPTGVGLSLVDTDSDSTPDYIDFDSDNDGIDDIDESFATIGSGSVGINGLFGNVETADNFEDVNGQAHDNVDFTLLLDFNNNMNPDGSNANGLFLNFEWRELVDTDLDGIVDLVDIDDDNDGILDVDESETADFDNDGVVNRLDLDADNDGIPDNRGQYLIAYL
jgi:hypothetical protein